MSPVSPGGQGASLGRGGRRPERSGPHSAVPRAKPESRNISGSQKPVTGMTDGFSYQTGKGDKVYTMHRAGGRASLVVAPHRTLVTGEAPQVPKQCVLLTASGLCHSSRSRQRGKTYHDSRCDDMSVARDSMSHYPTHDHMT